MQTLITRRSLMKRSAATAAVLGLSGLTAKSYANVLGSNDDIRIATIGFHSRGVSHINEWTRAKGVRLVALCDADEAVLDREYNRLSRGPSTRPSTQPSAQASADGDAEQAPAGKRLSITKFQDARKLLDDKSIDAISIATPNHWHALLTIWGCQAGKDVYVEKPIAHNIWEGRKAVEASRRHDRIVQAGTQWRSAAPVFEAMAWAKAGNIGKILVSRGLCYKSRPSIGKTEGPQEIPSTVDYDLWCGPAAKTELRRKNLHYDWHWVWNTGNGDIGNQGIHQMDLARWALGKNSLAPKVLSVGGRLGYVDDGETPNTLIACHDYGDSMLIFEVRGLPTKKGSRAMDEYRHAAVGNVIECEGGYVSIIKENQVYAYDKDGNEVKKFTGEGVSRDKNHFTNFIKAVRNRDRSQQNADIEEGHVSSALCHTSNISYRLGSPANQEEIAAAIKDDKELNATFDRMKEHLAANEVDIAMDKVTLGAPLRMDSTSERFVNNDKANALLTRQYRKPFVVPENV